MAFNVAYYDLLNKNIRHIYSSLPSNIRFRCDPDPGVTLNPHDGCVTSYKGSLARQPRGMPESLYRRLWCYSTEYNSPMPRAPAFRCVSASEARVIVDRVSQMTKTHRKRRQSYRPDEEDDRHDNKSNDDNKKENDNVNNKDDDTTSRRSTNTARSHRSSSRSSSRSHHHQHQHHRRCRSVAEMDALTTRVSRPTTSCKIRSDLREGNGLDPVGVVHQRTSEKDEY